MALGVRSYVSDGLCGFGFTCGGFAGLFDIITKACSKRAFTSVRKDLPILVIAGEDDPVGDYGRGVEKTYKKYRAAGVTGARLILYKGARHEILNDNCKKAATADVLSFVEENIVVG